MSNTAEYTPLEPSMLTSFGEGASFKSDTATTLFDSTSFLWTFSFVVIIVVASFRYAYAGILRIQGSEKGIKDSKEEFTRVTYGLLGVLGLWLILATINKDMLTGNVGLSDLRAKAGGLGSGVVAARPTSGVDTPFIPTNNDDPTGWNAIKNDRAVRDDLYTKNITVNKSVCTNPTQTSCTTVGGLPPETLSMLIQLKDTCKITRRGELVITGGSETGHKSHGPGKTPVDLSLNSPGGLEACIRGFQTGPSLDFCKKTYTNFGYIFCDELGVTHWHVYK